MKAYFLPEGVHLELLRAAFHNHPLEHWQRWRRHTTLDACEFRLHRLLPLVFRRLEKEAIDPADLKILRGVYRFNWTRNQLLARAAAEIIEALQAASVQVLVLKGMALAHLNYPDLGTRPMNDFDLLIHPEQRPLALQILEQRGWTPSHPLPDVSAHHGCEFVNAKGQQLDLHWYANSQCRWSQVDDGFWSRSQEMALKHVRTRTLCHSDMLLQVCLHGAKDGVDPVGWSSDACQLLLQAPDWSVFLHEARQRRVVLSLALTLGHLQQNLGASIPAWLLRELRDTPVPWVDRLYYLCKIRGGFGWSLWLQPVLEYLRSDRQGFLHFLRKRWGLKRVRDIPGHLAMRLIRS